MNDSSPSTRQSLLDAARFLFGTRGYDGTSVRAITTNASANLGAVTYHFGSKRALYEEVIGAVVEPLGRRVERAASGDGAPLERIAEVVRAFFRHLAENPDMPRLMLQEIAAGKDPPPPVARTLPSVLGRLAGIIVEGQRSGEIRAGDPRLMGLSCVAQPIHLTLVEGWARKLADIHMEEADQRQQIVEHAVQFAVAGLRAEP